VVIWPLAQTLHLTTLVCMPGENFDLRERTEVLGEANKRLKKQLKLYMKKAAESGGRPGDTYLFKVEGGRSYPITV